MKDESFSSLMDQLNYLRVDTQVCRHELDIEGGELHPWYTEVIVHVNDQLEPSFYQNLLNHANEFLQNILIKTKEINGLSKKIDYVQQFIKHFNTIKEYIRIEETEGSLNKYYYHRNLKRLKDIRELKKDGDQLIIADEIFSHLAETQYDVICKIIDEISSLVSILEGYRNSHIKKFLLDEEPDLQKTSVKSPLINTNTFEPISFVWKGPNINENLVNLFFRLSEKGFIDKDCDIKSFQKAFNGTMLKNSLNIKWTKKVKGTFSKSLLFYFLDELKENGHISFENNQKQYYKKIQKIFCDPNGKTIINFSQSYHQYMKRSYEKTPQEKELDTILSNLTV